MLMMLCITIPISFNYAGTIDPNISDNKYIEYANGFDYVGKVCGTYKDGTKFCASAVAIDDHHILTAAHVIKNHNECKVKFDKNIEKIYTITNIIIHKDFDEDKFGIADIAIGYSEEPFKLEFYPELYTDSDEIGKLCCMSGYGLTGNFLTGATKSDNKKRAGSNIIDNIEFDMLICSPSKQTDKTRTSLEFMIASGDSGGGLFIDNKLAGINSCVIATGKSKIPSSAYNNESGHTRISKFIAWIKEHRHAKK